MLTIVIVIVLFSPSQVDDMLQICFPVLARTIDTLSLSDVALCLEALIAAIPEGLPERDRLLHQACCCEWDANDDFILIM